jgi:hypothetical protein
VPAPSIRPRQPGDALGLLDDPVEALGWAVGHADVENPRMGGHHGSIVDASLMVSGMAAGAGVVTALLCP